MYKQLELKRYNKSHGTHPHTPTAVLYIVYVKYYMYMYVNKTKVPPEFCSHFVGTPCNKKSKSTCTYPIQSTCAPPQFEPRRDVVRPRLDKRVENWISLLPRSRPVGYQTKWQVFKMWWCCRSKD